MRPWTLALLVLLLAGCGSRTGGTAEDPADGDAAGPPDPPTAVPAAPGEVRTRGVVTVLDDGSGAEVCLGPVAESWPPQCGGPPLVGWDWRRQARAPGPAGEGTGFEQAAGVRWGQYVLAGRWDGESLTLTTAAPAAEHQPTAEEPTALPEPEQPVDPQRLERIARDLAGDLPGAQTSYVADGRAHVDVVYDDGSLQDWADETYGAGTVVVTGMLVDVADR
jgi:hypothetical protein